MTPFRFLWTWFANEKLEFIIPPFATFFKTTLISFFHLLWSWNDAHLENFNFTGGIALEVILPYSFAGTSIKMVEKLRFRGKTIPTNLTKMISFSTWIFQINFFNLRLVQRVSFENHWTHVSHVICVMWIIHRFIWIVNVFNCVGPITDGICSICQNFFDLRIVLVWNFLKFWLLFRC